MRQIVLDTETTGLGAESGHRIIEIGCVELVHRRLTGNHFHVYLNPQREIEDGAFRVHGISTQFLQDKPLFKDIVHQFIDFIDDSELIIHNAPFDVAFINVELNHCSWPKPLKDYCSVIDTLVLAREKHPGQRNTLDALCKRYEIDNSKRTLHGALLDAEILALVYLAMTGGQGSLFDDLDINSAIKNIASAPQTSLSSNSPVLSVNAEELKRHEDFIRFLVKKSGVDNWPGDIPSGL